MEPLSATAAIDAGAEEELFRRVSQQAAREALVRRWQQADPAPLEPACGRCGKGMKGLGARSKQLHTLCGEVAIERRVYYCSGCQRTEAPLDGRLGLDAGGLTPGLARVVCRSALELAYQQSQQLLTDTLGFSPCSAREVERIAKQHGQVLETGARRENTARAKADRKGCKPRAVYCLAVDGVLIPGLPDADSHRVNWHEVKLATGFDFRGLRPPFYVAGREEVEAFGKRLWGQLEQRGLDERNVRLLLADGAPWIWNLAETYFPEVAQLLDFYHAAEHLHATAEAVWSKGVTALVAATTRAIAVRSGGPLFCLPAMASKTAHHR